MIQTLWFLSTDEAQIKDSQWDVLECFEKCQKFAGRESCHMLIRLSLEENCENSFSEEDFVVETKIVFRLFDLFYKGSST